MHHATCSAELPTVRRMRYDQIISGNYGATPQTHAMPEAAATSRGTPRRGA